MDKVILNEEALFYGFVNCPKGFEIDRNEIKHNIMWGYIDNKDLNKYPVEHCLPLDYFNNYIKDFFRQKIKWKFNIIFKERFSYILKQEENVSIKDDTNPLDFINSPDYTLIYGVELEDFSSNLIIHHNVKRIPNCTWTIPMQNNKFILFPSHLKYEITKNKSKLNSFYLVQTYQELR